MVVSRTLQNQPFFLLQCTLVSFLMVMYSIKSPSAIPIAKKKYRYIVTCVLHSVDLGPKLFTLGMRSCIPFQSANYFYLCFLFLFTISHLLDKNMFSYSLVNFVFIFFSLFAALLAIYSSGVLFMLQVLITILSMLVFSTYFAI